MQRTKWNHDKPLSFLPDQYRDFDLDLRSETAVTPDEKVEKLVDRDFWAKYDCGVDWVEGYIDAQFPWKSTDDEIGAQLKPMYEELERAMGGPGSKTKIGWPVALLLATKR